MPKSLEIADLISSFTTTLERHIDELVQARLAEMFIQLDVRAPAPERRRYPAAQPTARIAVTAVHKARHTARRHPPAPPPVLALPKPKQATVIPSSVKITRLPPGPVPRQGTYSELRSRCRVPGCLEKNSGPRYDLMCRGHYGKLNAEERQKYKAMWKAAHGPQPAA